MKWSSILTLAAWGSLIVALCLLTVNVIPVETYDVQHPPDLIFTKQKETFEYLIEVLLSDNENCHSPNPITQVNYYAPFA
jgi:hypothetical protein